MDEADNIANQHVCSRCHQPLSEETGACNLCDNDHLPDAIEKERRLSILTVFFGMHLLVALLGRFTSYTRGLLPLMIADGALSALTIIYLVFFWKELSPLWKWPSFSFVKLISYASIAVIAAIVVHYAIQWVDRHIFYSRYYYYFAFSRLRYARLVTLLVVALQPAVFEELAFRGVLQDGLSRVTDKKQGLFIAAFLFTVLHMSFLSFFWLLPLALWLGYVRMKEKTLWYGVVIHFCFNATACLFEFFELHLY